MPRSNATLYLIWREPHSRAQHKIGELSYDGLTYRFRYARPDELGLAAAHGFHPAAFLPSFPDTLKEYESLELFPTFAHRLPDPKRPDYANVLARLNASAG